MLNLDTHIVLFTMSGALTTREREILSGDSWGISVIVLWELAKLVQYRRIAFDLRSAAFDEFLRNAHVWPIDRAVAEVSTQLDFRSDPADEVIAATSVVHSAPLVTRDAKILASSRVPFPG